MQFAIERALEESRQPELEQIFEAYPDLEDAAQCRAMEAALLAAFGN